MIFSERTCDIFAVADAEALVNPVNTVGIMGKGLALSFAQRFPGIVEPYQQACRQGILTVSHPHITSVGSAKEPCFVVNLATKMHWRNPSRIEWIEAGLSSMYEQLTHLGIASVAIPALGTGLGGLPAPQVAALVRHHAELNPHIHTISLKPR